MGLEIDGCPRHVGDSQIVRWVKVKLSLGASDGKEKPWPREREGAFSSAWRSGIASNSGKALPPPSPSRSGDTHRLIYFYRTTSATFRGDCFPPFTPSYLFSHFRPSTRRLLLRRLLYQWCRDGERKRKRWIKANKRKFIEELYEKIASWYSFFYQRFYFYKIFLSIQTHISRDSCWINWCLSWCYGVSRSLKLRGILLS